MDNATKIAGSYLIATPYAGERDLEGLLEKAIREERDGVLEELVKLKDQWFDDGPAVQFYQDLLRALLKRWEHVADDT